MFYVELIKSKLPRRQPWRWVAKSHGNHKKLATSGEHYTDKAEALKRIKQLFGSVEVRQR